MDEITISLIVAACVFSGAALSIFLDRLLPADHLGKETQDVLRLGTGMLSLLASLVLGLLVATTKSSFDMTDSEIKSAGVDIIVLDRDLRNYGPQTEAARLLLRRFAFRVLRDHWPAESDGRKLIVENRTAGLLLEEAQTAIRDLTPANPAQETLRSEALTLIANIVHTRWLLIEQSGSSVRPVFLIVLVAWIVVIFTSFGFNAPRNATVLAAFLVCSLAIGGAVFLILEMDSPFDGYIMVSSKPIRNALNHIRQE